MPAQIDVVNQTLNELGRLPVTNINDDNGAQIIANKLTVLLPELLLRTDWNFAINFFKSSSPIVNPPTSDFMYSYILPPDYGRFDRYSPFSGNLVNYYRIIDGMFLTNSNPLQFSYVSINVPYNLLPPLFYRCLSLYVAAEVCAVLTNDIQLTSYLEKKYQMKLVDAIRQNDMDRYITGAPYNTYDRIYYI